MQLEHIHRLALPGNQHFSDQGGLLRGLIREGLILFSWFLTLGFFFFFFNRKTRLEDAVWSLV